MGRQMKDSGIKWINEIPVDWSVCHFRNILEIYNGNSIKDEEKANYEDSTDGVPYIATKDIDATFHTISYDNGMYVKKSDEMFKRAPKNSVLLCIEGGSAGKKIAFTVQEVCFINKLCCFVSQSAYNRYVYYYMLSPAFTEEFKSHISGLIGGVSISKIKGFSIVLPPVDEQKRIAGWLDKKCGKIDEVISKTKATIDKYKNLKQSVITETVTKGIYSNRSIKDSGYEFIGEIPSEWGICKLRNIGVPQNGISKGAEFFGKGYPFVSYGDVYKNYSLPEVVTGLIESTVDERERYSVKAGDIFFTRTSETIEEVGFSCVCEKDIPDATFAGFLIRVRPFSDDLYAGYSKYYFRSNHHRIYLVKEMNLVTRASLGQDLLKSMPVLVPPLNEQKEIAEYLDKKCAEVDTIIAKKTALLEELEFYKKSLIYEYVTGKKEVPDGVI